MTTNQSMKTNLLQKLLNSLCPTSFSNHDRAHEQLIFGNWGCAIIILFFIIVAVLNGIADLIG